MKKDRTELIVASVKKSAGQRQWKGFVRDSNPGLPNGRLVSSQLLNHSHNDVSTRLSQQPSKDNASFYTPAPLKGKPSVKDGCATWALHTHVSFSHYCAVDHPRMWGRGVVSRGRGAA